MVRTSLLVASLLAPGLVRAGQDIPCGLVEQGSIHIDGLVSDWEGVALIELPVSPGKGGLGKPLSVRLRCNYDTAAMYLLIEVSDDILVRTRAAALTEDHLEFIYHTQQKGAPQRLLLWPGLSTSRIARSARLASGQPLRLIEGEGPAGRAKPLSGPPAFEVYDTLQPGGYAVEMRLPLRLLGGYRAGLPLPFGVRVTDVDSRAHPEPVAVAESCPAAGPLSSVQFAEAEAGLSALLGDLHMSQGDIWWEQRGDIGAGPARLLMIGRNLAVVSKQYGWQEVAPRRVDVLSADLVDIGAGSAVAVRTVEQGGGGLRELLRLYRMGPSGFQTIFAAEVRKQQGQSRLQSSVAYVRRGKAVDIVLSAQPAVGFTAESFSEQPASDAQPILLPWLTKSARFVLRDGTYRPEGAKP